jgi:hypothetical protein
MVGSAESIWMVNVESTMMINVVMQPEARAHAPTQFIYFVDEFSKLVIIVMQPLSLLEFI